MGLTKEEILAAAMKYGKSVISLVGDNEDGYRVCVQIFPKLLSSGLSIEMIKELTSKFRNLCLDKGQLKGCVSISSLETLSQYLNDIPIYLYYDIPVDNDFTFDLLVQQMSILVNKISDMVKTACDLSCTKTNKVNYAHIRSFAKELCAASYKMDIIPYTVHELTWNEPQQYLMFKGDFSAQLPITEFPTAEQVNLISEILALPQVGLYKTDKDFKIGSYCLNIFKHIVDGSYSYKDEILSFDCENLRAKFHGEQAVRLLPSITKAFINVVG